MPRQTSFRIWIRRSFGSSEPFTIRLESGMDAWSMLLARAVLLQGEGTSRRLAPEQVRQVSVVKRRDETVRWHMNALTDAVLYSIEAEEWIELFPWMDGERRMLLPKDADSIRETENAILAPDDEDTAQFEERPTWQRRNTFREALRRGAKPAVPPDESRDVVLREQPASGDRRHYRSLGMPESYRIVEDTEEEARALMAPWPLNLKGGHRGAETEPDEHLELPSYIRPGVLPASGSAFDVPEPSIEPPPVADEPEDDPTDAPSPESADLAPLLPDPAAPTPREPSASRAVPSSATGTGPLPTRGAPNVPALLRALRRQGQRHLVEIAVLEARITELEARVRTARG